MNKENVKVLLLEDISVVAKQNLLDNGFVDVELLNCALSDEDLINKIADVDVIGIRAKSNLSGDVLKFAKKLKLVVCFMVGTNNVDLEYCKLNNIEVINDPFSNNRSVAELVIGNIISLYRQIILKNKLSHEGIWDKSSENCFEVLNKNIGILGYGHIGVQVGILAEALGMNVYYYDVIDRPSIGRAISVDSLDELLKISDILSIHIPENKYTKNLINKDNLKLLPKNSLVINTARGSVVNNDALIELLELGHILGAGIDVFSDEPAVRGGEFKSLFKEFDNVILTPHIGANTVDAQNKIGLNMTNKIISFIEKL